MRRREGLWLVPSSAAPWALASLILLATRRRRLRAASLRGMAALFVADAAVGFLEVSPEGRTTLAARGGEAARFGASAAGFLVAASTAEPLLAPPSAALAAALVARRFAPAERREVMAGCGIGAAVALAGDWLVPYRTSARIRPPDPQLVQLPGNPEGEGVTIVVNPRSGSGRAEGQLPYLERELPKAAVVVLDGREAVADAMAKAAGRGGVLAVCGGDGTVNAAAAAAIESDVPLLVIPGGTFNHFAADLGMDRPLDAVRALRKGTCMKVDVATVNGRLFLNTSSVGAYPAFVARRERWEGRLGKPLAAALALVRSAREEHPISLEVDGRPYAVAMIFFGNCRYQPHGFAPNWRPSLDDGRLDVRIVSMSGPLPRLRLATSVLLGRLGYSRLYLEDDPVEIRVRRQSAGDVARDGEIEPGDAELHYAKLHRRLTVFQSPLRAIERR